MDRLQYNILLEESGIYDKRKIENGEEYDKESDYVYKNSKDNSIYQILPNDLTPEEIKISLLATQNEKLSTIQSTVSFIAVVIAIPFIICIFFLFVR